MWNAILPVVGIILVCLLWEMRREQKIFVRSRYKIQSAKLKGNIKVLFLSDLHNKSYGLHNEKLIHAVRDEQPDLILIGGDMLVGRKIDCFDEAVFFIQAISSVCPVYYALGNHEQRMKEDLSVYGDMFERYCNQFEGYDVHFIHNATKQIIVKDQKISVTGLEIFYKCYTKGMKRRDFTVEEMKLCVEQNKEDAYHILLAHNPAYMETYKKWGADLILSGHLHGGIIHIPGVGGLISPQFKLLPEYYGRFHHEKEADIVVSRGLGTHTVNLRLFNTAELVVLDLEGK